MFGHKARMLELQLQEKQTELMLEKERYERLAARLRAAIEDTVKLRNERDALIRLHSDLAEEAEAELLEFPPPPPPRAVG